MGSDDIGETALRAAEIPDAPPEKKGRQGYGEIEADGVERGSAAEDRPAEGIDNPGHGVERERKTPLRRDLAGLDRDG